MAYKADINIAVKGANDLARLRDRVHDTAKAIDAANARIQAFSKNASGVVRSVSNLNSIVGLAAKNFNEVALGTDDATFAARRYIDANKELNKGLRERAQLVAKIKEGDRVSGLARAGIRERTQYGGPIGPGAASGVLGGQSAPVDERIQRSLQTRRDEEVLQKALQKMELKSVDTQNKLLNARAKKLVLIREEVAKGKVLERMRQQRRAGSGFRDFSINAERFGAPSSPIMQGPQVSSAYQESFLQEKKRQTRLDRQLRVTRGRRKQQQMQGASANALIGGAFPLLFGQGPGAALGGAAGGFGGGMMGGQFGFALSLVGTNIGAAVDALVTGAANLGKALNPLTADIGLLTKAVGIAGTAEEARLKAIEALSGKQAALAEATRLLNQKIGVAGTEALKTFGENMRGVGNEFSVLMTKLGVAVATVVNDSGFIQFTNNFLDFANSLDQEKLNKITKFFAELAKNLAGFGPLDKVTKIIGGITGALGIKGNEKDQTITMDVVGDRTGMLADQFLGKEKDKRIDELAILEKTINGGKELGNIEKMRVDLKNKLKALNIDINNVDKDSLDAALKGLSAQDKQIDAYKRQLALAKQIKSVLAEGMSSAIEGLITGTKSLSESFSQMLRQFGSLLLRTGISNMMGGLNLGGFFGKGIGSAEGNYLANGIRPFASGGMVTRPTMGLVGEAGEDEYVIPASKMAQSMQRYSSGARGQSVIPGTGASSSGGAFGSSTTVNYSGPILNFNSEEFVPKSAVGQIINSAASKGAAAGESRTMSTLRNSRGARARIGM